MAWGQIHPVLELHMVACVWRSMCSCLSACADAFEGLVSKSSSPRIAFARMCVIARVSIWPPHHHILRQPQPATQRLPPTLPHSTLPTGRDTTTGHHFTALFVIHKRRRNNWPPHHNVLHYPQAAAQRLATTSPHLHYPQAATQRLAPTSPHFTKSTSHDATIGPTPPRSTQFTGRVARTGPHTTTLNAIHKER